jgi:hypothetical protein
VSSGCIRLTNEDIADLYGRVQLGTRVVVLPGTSPGAVQANTNARPIEPTSRPRPKAAAAEKPAATPAHAAPPAAAAAAAPPAQAPGAAAQAPRAPAPTASSEAAKSEAAKSEAASRDITGAIPAAPAAAPAAPSHAEEE